MEVPVTLQPYRTVLTLLLFGGMDLVVYLLTPHEMRVAIAPVLLGSLTAKAIAAAGKSSFEHWTKRGQNGP